MKIAVRAALSEDIDRLAKLVFDFREEHTRMLGGKSKVSLDDAREEVKKHLNRDDAGYFVALDRTGKLVGFRRWELHDRFYFTRELYVVDEFRRKGVARALIRHFERWLLEKGQDIACISCTPHNLAMIMLSRSEGYDILNMIEMRKDLRKQKRAARSRREVLGLEWKIL